MNEVMSTIYSRRAIRKYKDKSITRKQIEELLDAGRMAPSAMNWQPWKFYVITKEEQIKLMSEEIVKEGLKNLSGMGIKKVVKAVVSGIANLSHGIDFMRAEDPIFHKAPVVIFIVAPKDNEWAALDIGMCSQNIMLAAKSLGLDTCPIGFGKFIEKTSHYSYLGIPTDEQVHLAIIVGYGDESPVVHERKKDNIFFR